MYILAEPYTVSTTCYLIFFFNINYVNNFRISTCMLLSPHLHAHTVKNAKIGNLRHIDNPAHSISRGATTSKQVPHPTLLNSSYSSHHSSPHHHTSPLNNNSKECLMFSSTEYYYSISVYQPLTSSTSSNSAISGTHKHLLLALLL